ncbi:MAG: T9SS type A sorting domain-containing protein [Ignavibacteria bacterium]|nr:T9SS type A sorting domain-containing protein [Ignavibacteria bacterium]
MVVMSEGIFVPNEVDMVISGHNHFYQHNLVDNIHHIIISPTGGTKRIPTYASYTIKAMETYCFGVFDVSPKSFSLKVYNEENELIDKIYLTKSKTIKGDGFISNEVKLTQNFPNPFNPSTKISYSLPLDDFVRIVIYDITGKEIKVLLNKNQSAGTYEVFFDASEYSSGVYFYKLTTGNFSETRKMILLR